MSLQAVTMWQFGCDWPGCAVTAQDYSEYAAWSDPFAAVDDVETAGWWFERGRERGYCLLHPVAWASGDGPHPVPPYLLVHDGDTDEDEDDGFVTRITPDGAT